MQFKQYIIDRYTCIIKSRQIFSVAQLGHTSGYMINIALHALVKGLQPDFVRIVNTRLIAILCLKNTTC